MSTCLSKCKHQKIDLKEDILVILETETRGSVITFS